MRLVVFALQCGHNCSGFKPPQKNKGISAVTKKIITAAAIPVLVLLLALIFYWLEFFIFSMPPCRLYYFFELMCPGCGGTRSVEALLRGDIFTSFRLNPLVIFACLLGMAFYAELIFSIFNRKIKIVPRSMAFLWVMVGIFSVFYVVRHFIPFFAIY